MIGAEFEANASSEDDGVEQAGVLGRAWDAIRMWIR